MSKPLPDSRIDQLIADYLADSLSDADRPVFEDWLRASPENPRRVARLSVTDYAIREVCQDTKADYLLDVLNQIDDAAGPAQLVTLHHIDSRWQRYRLPFAIGGAIAAVLLIAVTLIITLQGPASAPSLATNTTTPNMPAASTESTPRGSNPVATLTAEHDAQWAEGALAPGSQLRAGDRFTLTQGLAEITTNDGAVAILEAPATIELLDENALRLHSGKLVGICETESSQGFLVRTPNIDVTDLGTRFGVDAKETGATFVRVFTGQVICQSKDNDRPRGEPIELSAGDAMAINNDGELLEADGFGQNLFATLRQKKPGIAFRTDACVVLDAPLAVGDPASWPSGDQVYLFEEASSVRTDRDFMVTLQQPGVYSQYKLKQPGSVVPAGSVLRSYILMVNSGQPGVSRVGTATVRFEGTIVGVITDASHQSSFARAIGSDQDGLFLLTEGSAFPNVSQPDRPDTVTLHDDGRAISLSLVAMGGCDFVRVLVADAQVQGSP